MRGSEAVVSVRIDNVLDAEPLELGDELLAVLAIRGRAPLAAKLRKGMYLYKYMYLNVKFIKSYAVRAS